MTPHQREVLVAIHTLTHGGVAPSYDEIKAHCGIGSKSKVFERVVALTERGYLQRQEHKARAVEITPKGLAAIGKTPTCAALASLSDIDLYDLKARVIAECERRLDMPRSPADEFLDVALFGGEA